MRQGTMELVSVGIAFLALQIWWISMTLRNGDDKKLINSNKDRLAEQKARLEDLLNK